MEEWLNREQIKYRLLATANQAWSGYNSSESRLGYLDVRPAVNNTAADSANTGIPVNQMLSTVESLSIGEA